MSVMNCPECAGAIAPKSAVALGELIACADCGAKLEVMGIEPLSLGLAPQVEEDWGE